jgi:hypothetical protein
MTCGGSVRVFRGEATGQHLSPLPPDFFYSSDFELPGFFDYLQAGQRFVKMYQISNIYGITAIAVIGGGLFGFDISSMSAMYDSFTPLD